MFDAGIVLPGEGPPPTTNGFSPLAPNSQQLGEPEPLVEVLFMPAYAVAKIIWGETQGYNIRAISATTGWLVFVEGVSD